MKFFLKTLLIPVISIWVTCTNLYATQIDSFTFFSQTKHPLKVYYLQGNNPGPTVMLQGGIQGDEPTGFYTAQLFCNAQLQKGNLIIVPRANVPAIIQGKRLINVDLNRRFDKNYSRFYEDVLARAIRFLIGQSDALIHLHEGSGFYNPKYINKLRNPDRWGQSFIIDSAVYKDKLHLAKQIKKVLPRVNSQIITASYEFELFNTRTNSPKTEHPEQRKSLTYYSLYTIGIPATAIEVSKDITDKALKLKHQLMATRNLLDQFEVQYTLHPYSQKELSRMLDKMQESKFQLKTRENKYQPGETVTLSRSSKIKLNTDQNRSGFGLSPIKGLFSQKYPELNLLSCNYLPQNSDSKLLLSLDGNIKASWPLKWQTKRSLDFFEDPVFVCSINENLRFVPAGETIISRQGDRFLLLGMWNKDKNEILNVKGYVSNPRNNDGQDKGHEIILNQDFFISRYLDYNSDLGLWSFNVVRETSGKKRVAFTVKVLPRNIRGIQLSNPRNKTIYLPFENEKTYYLSRGSYELEEIMGSGNNRLFLPIVNGKPLHRGEEFNKNVEIPVLWTGSEFNGFAS